jgi:hypothetical protein
MLENLYLEYIEEIGTTKQLAKNPEKCAYNSFFKAEDDPDSFLSAIGKWKMQCDMYTRTSFMLNPLWLCLI